MAWLICYSFYLLWWFPRGCFIFKKNNFKIFLQQILTIKLLVISITFIYFSTPIHISLFADMCHFHPFFLFFFFLRIAQGWKKMPFNAYLFPKPNLFLSYKSWECRLYLFLSFFFSFFFLFLESIEYVKRINMLEYLRHDFI